MAKPPCSFCGKRRVGELKLLAAPVIRICDDCVAVCRVLDRDLGGARPGAAPGAARPVAPDAPDANVRRLLNAGRPLTAQEEVDLAKRIERGDLDAQQELVESNLRLVVSIARTHGGRGLSFLDRVRAGALGLARASEVFDYRKWLRFSSYAGVWIRQAIARGRPGLSR